MNEEFDKYVRNLLQDAEEEVSPRVWEGVAAGLNRKARVVPVWHWAVASVAAAAAVVAAFVVFHSNPTISSIETPAATALVEPAEPTPVAEEAIPVTAEEALPVSVPFKVVAAARTAQVQEQPAVSAVLADVRTAPVQAREPVRLVQKAIAPDLQRMALVDDHSLLNQLAYSEHKTVNDGGFSLLAAGHIQGNQRGKVQTPFGPQPYAAPPQNAADGLYNEAAESNFRLPFSIALGVKYNFTPRWAVGTGLRYTNLGRTFLADYVASGLPFKDAVVDNQQHWLGVPVNLYYDIVNRGPWRVHTFVGGTAEFLLSDDFLVHHSTFSQDQHFHESSSSLQWSIGAGLGLEFKLNPHWGLFLDPSVRYYFRSEDLVKNHRSLRTIQPLRFDIEAGVRFSFGQK